MTVWIILAHLTIPGYGTLDVVLPKDELSYVFATEKQCKDHLSTYNMKPEARPTCESRGVTYQ